MAGGASPRTRARLTEAQAARLREGHAQGLSQGELARELKIDRPRISRWAKREGLLWGTAPAGAEQQAMRIKAGRANLAEAVLSDALALREQLWSDDELPTAAQIRDLAGAVERLVRAHQHLNAAVSDTSATAAVSMVSRLQDALKQVVAADD